MGFRFKLLTKFGLNFAMPDIPLLLSQIAPDDIEVTPGKMLSAMAVMFVMAASAAAIGLWVIRIRSGQEIFPSANRKPLIVPRALLVGGVLLTGMMAALVFLAPETSDTAAANEAAVAGAEAETAADAEAETVEGADAEDPEDGAAEAHMMRMMADTVSFNLMMFCVFGLVIWMTQQRHSRQLTEPTDLSYAESDAPLPATFEASAAVPSTSEGLENYGSSTNPFAPPNPFLQEAVAPPFEEWCFATELRFAAETFLVAYLPTAVLRILILSMLPESPSHPFLEIMENGISISMMCLIGVMAMIVAPAVEELLYRVTILGGFMQQKATVVGWLVSSVLFGFAHGFPDSIALLPLAFAIGYTYIRRRSYRTVMLVHFLFNAFNMFIAGISLG